MEKSAFARWSKQPRSGNFKGSSSLLRGFRGNARTLDHRAPALRLGNDQIAERCRRAGCRLDALIDETLNDNRGREYAVELGIESLDDRLRCTSWRHEAIPRI